jgi:hypothetical protein
MKFLSIVAVLTFSLSAFANNKVATCTTIGDALDSVELISGRDGKIAKIKVNSMDPNNAKTYNVSKELSSLSSKSGLSLIAAKNLDAVYGGAIFDAVKLDLNANLTRGTLAADKAVFFLNCQK